MKKRFYAGLALEKDLRFCAYMDELRSHPGVLIIREGERVLVHEMEYTADYLGKPEQIDTGRTHEGYASHYVEFLFGDLIIYMQAATYFPFTDENEPGEFNFIPYGIISPSQKHQLDFYLPYAGIASIGDCGGTSRIRRDSHRTSTDWSILLKHEQQIASLVRTNGGIREKSIWNNGNHCVMLKGHTWNDEHKVVQVVSLITDDDGHRDSFDVDLVCGKFC